MLPSVMRYNLSVNKDKQEKIKQLLLGVESVKKLLPEQTGIHFLVSSSFFSSLSVFSFPLAFSFSFCFLFSLFFLFFLSLSPFTNSTHRLCSSCGHSTRNFQGTRNAHETTRCESRRGIFDRCSIFCL